MSVLYKWRQKTCHRVVRSLFSRCSVVVQSNTEQRLNNERTTGDQQPVLQREKMGATIQYFAVGGVMDVSKKYK